MGYSCWASDALCRVCFEELPRIGRPVCGRCGAPTAFEVYGCGRCRDEGFELDGVRVPLRYVGVGKELVRGLKYKGYLRVVEKVIALLVTGALGGSRFNLVVPVSLHRSRITKRKFNQLELMAKAVTGEINVPVSDKLRTVRRTRDQVELPAEARRANVAGAYASRGLAVGSILLKDDIFATGAALSECAGVLRRVGTGEDQAQILCRTC